MPEFTRVARLSDVPAGTLKSIYANAQALVLANVDGTICALEDRCSHEEYPLSDGELDGNTLVCMHHGARFDACTGRNKGLPAVRPVRSFRVEIRDGEVFVEV